MDYTISYQNPHQHFIDIVLTVDTSRSEKIYLQLPAWRPGRYEVTNFAQNIRKLSVTDETGRAIPCHKVSKDRWEVDTTHADKINVTYDYYACRMDGGGSWLDENQLYVNFINCMLYVEGRQEETVRVTLKLPEDYQIACGLPQQQHCLKADSYFHLVDSPVIASNQLKHLEYTVAETRFHLWIMGDWEPDEAALLRQFRAFTLVQIQTMGSFPCADYHFMFQILPYAHYHGVEHFNSTVIVLGPSERMIEDGLYNSMLGVSSHELFHTWNVIRIRPKEMMPYDFSRQNYFKTGFVAEGVTTYYGDLFLVRSQVISREIYLLKLNQLLKRHFENFGRSNLSVADSSFDLWLDGYVPGIPNRKSSIYVEGAVTSLILDLMIRKMTAGLKSLDDVMWLLWEEFGETAKGYSQDDYQRIAEEVAGESLRHYFDRYIYGTAPTEEILSELLPFIGCELSREPSDTPSENIFGFKTTERNHSVHVSAIEPGAIAEKWLSIDDELIAVNGRKINLNVNALLYGKNMVELSYFRNHQLKTCTLENTGEQYYTQRKIVPSTQASPGEIMNFKKWLGETTAEAN